MNFEAFIEGYKVFLDWPPQTCPCPSGFAAPRLDSFPLTRGDWGLRPLILLICLGIFITMMRKG